MEGKKLAPRRSRRLQELASSRTDPGCQGTPPGRTQQAPKSNTQVLDVLHSPAHPRDRKRPKVDGDNRPRERERERKPIELEDPKRKSKSKEAVLDKHATTPRNPRKKRLGHADLSHKDNEVEAWLTDRCASPANQEDVLQPVNSQRSVQSFPSRSLGQISFFEDMDSSGGTATGSSAVGSPHNPDIRMTYEEHFNIFIEANDPPKELMTRARAIVQAPRGFSLGLGESELGKIVRNARAMQNQNEGLLISSIFDRIITQIGDAPAGIIPRRNSLWVQRVPVAGTESASPPLNAPKPDALFGFVSRLALTASQQKMATSLKRGYGTSYAWPDKEAFMPFLSVEYKSLAKRKSRYVAINQAAHAGAIMLQACQELSMRAFGYDHFMTNDPRYFSIAMENDYAVLHVHWMGRDEAARLTCNMEEVANYALRRPAEVQALHHAVSNILEYAKGSHLTWIRKALDAYGEKLSKDPNGPSAAAS